MEGMHNLGGCTDPNPQFSAPDLASHQNGHGGSVPDLVNLISMTEALKNQVETLAGRVKKLETEKIDWKENHVNICENPDKMENGKKQLLKQPNQSNKNSEESNKQEKETPKTELNGKQYQIDSKERKIENKTKKEVFKKSFNHLTAPTIVFVFFMCLTKIDILVRRKER